MKMETAMHLGKLKMLKSLILPDHLCCWKFFCVVFPFWPLKVRLYIFWRMWFQMEHPEMWQSSACQRSNSPLPKISLGWMAVLAILLRGNSFPVILVSTKKRNPGLANHARQGTDAWEELEGQVASCKPCCIQVASLKTMAQGCFGCYIIILRLPQTRQRIGRRRVPQRLSKRCFCQSDRQFQLHWMCRRLFRSICWLCGLRSVSFRLWRSRKRPWLMFSMQTRVLYAFRWSNKMLALW